MRPEQRHALEARAAAAVCAVVRRLPRRLVLALGRTLGRLWAALDRRHLRIAAENLRQAFPEWTEKQVQRTARGVYAHFGTILFDILWMERRGREELLALTDVEGLEHARAAMALERGAVCPTGHFGNWEFQGIASPLLVGPFAVVARPLDNPQLDRRLVALRTSTGNSVIYKKKALAQIMQTVRSGGLVAIVIDQNVQEKDGIFVDFFGRPACTTTVAAAVALKTGCMILPVHCVLGPTGRYRMIYGPPVEWEGRGRGPGDVAELTQRLTSIIEGWVREHPEQWLWLHRRWKTQPSAMEMVPATRDVPAPSPSFESGSGAEDGGS
jgi:KDO2-lipid IV(A) lauroyltransferase